MELYVLGEELPERHQTSPKRSLDMPLQPLAELDLKRNLGPWLGSEKPSSVNPVILMATMYPGYLEYPAAAEHLVEGWYEFVSTAEPQPELITQWADAARLSISSSIRS